MSCDFQDILAAPAGTCVLVEDHFNILLSLVNCSGDIESGCLKPFESNDYYKAYRLNVDTNYYSTTIRILSFDTAQKYRKWQNQKIIENVLFPSAIFICVDVNQSEEELEAQIEQIDSLNVGRIDTRSLILLGQLPCSVNNVDSAKTKLIQRFVDKNYIETVKFHPNEEELEELEENHEKHGIERIWELLGIAEWPSKIMKQGAGRFEAELQKSNGAATSLSTKCNPKQSTISGSLAQKLQETTKEKQSPTGMEPTPEDERLIFNFFMNAKQTIPEPEFKVDRLPELSMRYLMKQREHVQKGLLLSCDKYVPYSYSSWPPTQAEFDQLATETNFYCPQNLKDHFSVIDINDQFEPNQQSRVDSASIKLASTTQPLTTEQILTVQQNKKKKSKHKKSAADECPSTTALPTSSANKRLEEKKSIKEVVERIFDRIHRDTNANKSGESLDELVENWSNVKDDHPPSDEKVRVATQLTKTYIEQEKTSQSSVGQHSVVETSKSQKQKSRPDIKKNN